MPVLARPHIQQSRSVTERNYKSNLFILLVAYQDVLKNGNFLPVQNSTFEILHTRVVARDRQAYCSPEIVIRILLNNNPYEDPSQQRFFNVSEY